jgi:uncharacterized protein
MTDSTPLLLRKPGAFYTPWGLAFVLIFVMLFQLIFAFLAIAACSLIFHLPFGEVRQLLSTPDGTANAINVARLSNLIAFTGFMLLPALLFTYINATSPSQEAGWNKGIKAKWLGLSLAAVTLCLPIVNWMTQIIHDVKWSQQIKYYADKFDNGRQDMVNTVLDMNSPGELFICLFIIALLPAVFEELMFRGILMNIFIRITQKKWTPIVLQALVFSLLHFSFYELPGIFLMGFIFGIIAYTTKTTWYTIIMHFLFNATSVILHYFSLRNFEKTGISDVYDDVSIPGIYIFFALFPLIYILVTFFRNRVQTIESTE